MNYLKEYAKREFKILKKQDPNSNILKYKKEIINLIKKFDDDNSGTSAAYIINLISNTIYNLLSYTPITPIVENPDDWVDVTDDLYQHKRCGQIFKYSYQDLPYYLDAILWKDNDYTFIGKGIYQSIDGLEITNSRQYFNYPFTPKTFVIDVIRHYLNDPPSSYDKNFDYRIDDNGKAYIYIVKDLNQLNEAFKYYQKF